MAKTKRTKKAKRRTGSKASRVSSSARTRPARKAARKAGKARKTAKPRKTARTRRPARKTVKRRTARAARKAARRKPARKAASGASKRRQTAARKPARKAAGARKAARRAPRSGAAATARRTTKAAGAAGGSTRPHRSPPLDRDRRQLPDAERLAAAPISDDRMTAAARSGHHELQERLHQHTEADPRLTGGDIDARWEDAYAVGDEAPGGDNPTPDQDRVDDIGRALGVRYQDNEELKSGDKIAERDRHRWEYNPASSDDWPHDRKS